MKNILLLCLFLMTRNILNAKYDWSWDNYFSVFLDFIKIENYLLVLSYIICMIYDNTIYKNISNNHLHVGQLLDNERHQIINDFPKCFRIFWFWTFIFVHFFFFEIGLGKKQHLLLRKFLRSQSFLRIFNFVSITFFSKEIRTFGHFLSRRLFRTIFNKVAE